MLERGKTWCGISNPERLEQKEQRLALQERAETDRQRTLHRELECVRVSAGAVDSTARAPAALGLGRR